MKFVFMKTQNATQLSDQSDVRALYSCTEREQTFLCHAEAVFWLVIRWSWFWWKMAVDWVQDLQPWQLSSKLLLNYTAHEWLESDFSSQCCWTWLLFVRDEVFGDVIRCWICWSVHFDQAPVRITVYGCLDLCYSRLNFCWRQLIFRWLWEVFTTKF